MFCLFPKLYLFDLQLLLFNTFQKVINRVSWLDDRHGDGLSPILYDTVPLFVCTDQLQYYAIIVSTFICSKCLLMVDLLSVMFFYGASACWLSHWNNKPLI